MKSNLAIREKLVASIFLLLLLAGLGLIQAMFFREQAETLARIQSRIALRNDYAQRVLAELLARTLEAQWPRIEVARSNPLAADRDLFLRLGEHVVLPRVWTPQSEDGVASRIENAGLDIPRDLGLEAGPALERFQLARAVAARVGNADRPGIEAAMRAFLEHRSRFLLPAEIDLPITFLVLEDLQHRSAPDPSLMQALLLDGFGPPTEPRIEGLLPALVRHRDRFSARETAMFHDRLLGLTEAYGVPSTEFRARIAESPVEAPNPSTELESPVVDGRFEWYFERRGSETRGCRVDPAALRAELEAELRARSVMGPTDVVSPFGVRQEAAAFSPVSVWPVKVSAHELEAEVPAARRRFITKTSLVAGTSLLAVTVFLLGLAWQRRERTLIELKTDFVSTVSHELRTPLASVRLLAETLERRLAGDERAKDYPSRIVREVDGASFLVENILSFHRIDKGRWALYPETIDLFTLFRQAAVDLGAQLGREVALGTGGGPAIVSGDPELLRLLVSNLVKNAIVYNDRSPVTIEVEARLARGSICVTVRDNGTGIDPSEHEKVFVEFHRGKASGGGRRAGSGLGLALVRRIAELHGGTVRLVTSDASGSCFELELPAGPSPFA